MPSFAGVAPVAMRKYFDFSISEIYDTSLIKYKEKWGALSHEFVYYSKNFSALRCQLWNYLFKIFNSKFGNVLYEIIKKDPGEEEPVAPGEIDSKSASNPSRNCT